MQISGSGVRIPAPIVEEFLPSMPQLRGALERYWMMHAFQAGQIAVCNRLHELDQRRAR